MCCTSGGRTHSVVSTFASYTQMKFLYKKKKSKQALCRATSEGLNHHLSLTGYAERQHSSHGEDIRGRWLMFRALPQTEGCVFEGGQRVVALHSRNTTALCTRRRERWGEEASDSPVKLRKKRWWSWNKWSKLQYQMRVTNKRLYLLHCSFLILSTDAEWVSFSLLLYTGGYFFALFKFRQKYLRLLHFLWGEGGSRGEEGWLLKLRGTFVLKHLTFSGPENTQTVESTSNAGSYFLEFHFFRWHSSWCGSHKLSDMWLVLCGTKWPQTKDPTGMVVNCSFQPRITEHLGNLSTLCIVKVFWAIGVSPFCR